MSTPAPSPTPGAQEGVRPGDRRLLRLPRVPSPARGNSSSPSRSRGCAWPATVAVDGCVSSRHGEDVFGKVFPLVSLSPRVRTLLSCDIALLIGRLMLGVVLFAHGWQKLVIKGIGGTYAWFQAMG